MTRAAIYARLSIALQDERSIDGQVALCCDFATNLAGSKSIFDFDALYDGAEE